MSECYKHEKNRRAGSLCPYCRIAELEAVIEGRELGDLEEELPSMLKDQAN